MFPLLVPDPTFSKPPACQRRSGQGSRDIDKELGRSGCLADLNLRQALGAPKVNPASTMSIHVLMNVTQLDHHLTELCHTATLPHGSS